jgi:iron complex transport system substrate-binding protein
VPDLVRAAGGEPVAALPGERSREATWAEFADAEPDIVIVSPCGYHLDGAAAQAQAVLTALPGPEVWAIDGDGLVVRPGPRVVTGVEAIASVLHPGAVEARPEAVRRIGP